METKDIDYYLALAYTKLLKADGAGNIIATIQELDGCMADGADEAEALAELRIAQREWLTLALEAGRTPPVPEQDEELPSGKFLARFPRYLHGALNRLAKKDGVSLNHLLSVAAAEHVARREGRQEMVRDVRKAWAPMRGEWDRATDAGRDAKTGPYLESLMKKGSAGETVENHRHAKPQLVKRG